MSMNGRMNPTVRDKDVITYSDDNNVYGEMLARVAMTTNWTVENSVEDDKSQAKGRSADRKCVLCVCVCNWEKIG